MIMYTKLKTLYLNIVKSTQSESGFEYLYGKIGAIKLII